jgi:carboxymethylenebutenolidase
VPDVDLTAAAAARSGSRPLRGYVAVPAGVGPWPGVVVLHEITGLTAGLRRQADRLAAAGYLALAVDLFSAGGLRRCLVPTMRALSAGTGPAFADIAAARDALVARSDCTGRTGVIGFCMGGGFALLSARSGFDAASVNYGPLPADLDAAVDGACPLVASYGARDRGLRGAAARLERALADAGVPHDVREYPTAGHAFLTEEGTATRVLRPLLRVAGIGPDPAAAVDAWRRIEDFLAAHLR